MSEATQEPSTKPNRSLGDVDYRGFVPTADAVQLAARIHHAHEGRHNWTSEFLNDDASSVISISDFIASLGFRRLDREIKYGAHALVFEGNDGQIIRLVNERVEQSRLESPLILEPIATYQVGQYRIELLPKVCSLAELRDKNNETLRDEYGISSENENLLNKFAKQLINDSLKENIIFWDVKDDNIAVIKNEKGELVPLILDGDAAWVVPEPSRFNNEYGKMLRFFERFTIMLKKINSEDFHKKADDCLNELGVGGVYHISRVFNNFIKDYKANHAEFSYPAKYYSDAQVDHLESLGLEKGAPNKVLTDEQLDSALREFVADRTNVGEQAYDPTKMLGYAALKAGVSKSEFGAAARVAGKKHFRAVGEKGKEILLLSEVDAALGDERPGFCHQIRAELEKNHGVDLSGRM